MRDLKICTAKDLAISSIFNKGDKNPTLDAHLEAYWRTKTGLVGEIIHMSFWSLPELFIAMVDFTKLPPLAIMDSHSFTNILTLYCLTWKEHCYLNAGSIVTKSLSGLQDIRKIQNDLPIYRGFGVSPGPESSPKSSIVINSVAQ